MKKDSFLKGALVATFCIVFSKILGIIYVIPFHAIIGQDGRALYSYAYNMYMLFLNFSTVGIPLAISKIVSEYHSLGYEDAKKRTYRIAVKITLIMAILSTVALIILAPTIANTIIGDIQGGNSKENITFVLRVSASAILFVTILSGVRGYLQGHKYITISSISQVIEQFVRVVVIIVGSFIAMKLFGTKEAVGIAIFGATIGSIAALIYLEIKMKEERKKEKKIPIKEEEKKLTNNILAKQLLKYTLPFIIVSVAAGVVVAVLPNITSDYTKKNYTAVNQKINKTLQMILYFVIPMVLGLSFLALPVWKVFYGTSELGVSVFSYSIFTAIFYSLFLNIHTIMQSVDNNKMANISIISGLITKICLTVPLIILFSKITFIPTYYASVTATILAYIVPITISLICLHKTRNISFKETFINSLKIIGAGICMILVLSILKLLIPLAGNKIYSLIIIIIYALIGGSVYFILTSKMHVFEDIFECSLKEFIKKKLRR